MNTIHCEPRVLNYGRASSLPRGDFKKNEPLFTKFFFQQHLSIQLALARQIAIGVTVLMSLDILGDFETIGNLLTIYGKAYFV